MQRLRMGMHAAEHARDAGHARTPPERRAATEMSSTGISDRRNVDPERHRILLSKDAAEDKALRSFLRRQSGWSRTNYNSHR